MYKSKLDLDVLNSRKGNTSLKIILGQAGSGKSTKLLDIVSETERPIILCSKWLLVNNMIERLAVRDIKCRVHTIQSIVERPDNAGAILAGVNTIFIDEFSQISYAQLLSLIDSAEKVGITDMIVSGDFLQNEPIEGGSYSPMRHIIRQFMLGNTSNFFASLIKSNVYEQMASEADKTIEVPQALTTLFNDIEYEVMTKNFRQKGAITIRNFNDIAKLLSDNYPVLEQHGFPEFKLNKAINNKDWQIIVADWNQMKSVNQFAYMNNAVNRGDKQFYIDVRGYSDSTKRKYYVKDGEGFRLLNGRYSGYLSQKDILNIQPTYAIIADSAQGLEFENVLLYSRLNEEYELERKYSSWSNFSFNSLYMAATRHINEVDFCLDDKGFKDIQRALTKMPHAKKSLVSEEWLMYCVCKAPDPIIGYEEYIKRTHFIKDDNKLYSIIGMDKEKGIPPIKISFAANTEHQIDLYTEYRFMYLWLRNRGEHERVREVFKEIRKSDRVKASKCEQFIIETGVENIDFSLSVRKFKAAYGLTKGSVQDAVETYTEWLE